MKTISDLTIGSTIYKVTDHSITTLVIYVIDTDPLSTTLLKAHLTHKKSNTFKISKNEPDEKNPHSLKVDYGGRIYFELSYAVKAVKENITKSIKSEQSKILIALSKIDDYMNVFLNYKPDEDENVAKQLNN